MWEGDITFEESLHNILPAMAEKVEEKMPENGKFKRFGYYFDVDASFIEEAGVWFDYDSQDPLQGRIVILSAQFPGESRKMSEYVFWGTKAEIVRYLKDPDRVKDYMEAIKELDIRIRMHD